jgi:two-component system, OmpR family, alkaline phosphatase synthesis response regulator PhoP
MAEKIKTGPEMEKSDYRILLVDDETDTLEFISYNLAKEGYEIHQSLNGMDAVIQAGKILPHLILLDVMMPGLDGLETCRELRKNDQLDQTVIVFLTARGDHSRSEGYKAGANYYMTKPISPEVLINRINAILAGPGMPGDDSDYQSTI